MTTDNGVTSKSTLVNVRLPSGKNFTFSDCNIIKLEVIVYF